MNKLKSKKYSYENKNKSNNINKKIKKSKNQNNIFSLIIVKLILIILFLSIYFYINSEYKNTIPLLAVNELDNGKIVGGSVINLSLKIKPGSGKIYINLNSIEEIDTQISIINSQKTACKTFNLDCQDYDFYYDFTGSALLLKGPSASTAIAILTAKTMRKEKITSNSAITGALNSGGVIGNVGGVDEKIKVAKEKGFNKVLIPIFSKINKTEHNRIKIVKVLDLVDAYNKFNNDNFKAKKYFINKTKYENLMKQLSDDMCLRSASLKNEVNTKLNKFNFYNQNNIINNKSNIDNNNNNSYNNIINNTKLNLIKPFLKQAEKSYNLSLISNEEHNYYSRGSFCYNSNINYQMILLSSENLSNLEINNKVNLFEKEVTKKYSQIKSNEFKNKLITINDFYTYLLLNNRINEAKNYIKEIRKIKIENFDNKSNKDINIDNITINISKNISSENIIHKNNSNESLINKNLENNYNKLNKNNQLKINQKLFLFSTAIERKYTINLWEKFIDHSGTRIKFDQKKIVNVCRNINREIAIKSELLDKYNLHFLDNQIDKQNEYNLEFTNQYLCIYNGLELNGKIDTILNSIGINNKNNLNYTKMFYDFTKSKLSINSKGDFPLLPYIYTEYGGDLLKQNDTSSSMLYLNYALSYLDLNLYLEDKSVNKSIFNNVLKESFNNPLFLLGILIIIAFTGY